MSYARVFKSGNSQAVRLPKEFRFETEKVEIFRRGDEIVLREKPGSALKIYDALASLPQDLFAEERNDIRQAMTHAEYDRNDWRKK